LEPRTYRLIRRGGSLYQFSCQPVSPCPGLQPLLTRHRRAACGLTLCVEERPWSGPLRGELDRVVLDGVMLLEAAGQFIGLPGVPLSARLTSEHVHPEGTLACVLQFQTPRLGLEPRTYRLTAGRSTIELSGNVSRSVSRA